MVKINITLLIFAVLFQSPIYAWDECFYSYSYDHETMTASVTSINAPISNSSPRDAHIPETVLYGYKEYVVTSISNGAGKGREYLHGVYLPNTIETIGDEAFKDCEHLDTVSLGNNVKIIGNEAFCNLSILLKSISIPESVTHIGKGAFKNNYIENIIFHEGLQTIGDEAFYRNSPLSSLSLEIPNSVDSIGSRAFYGCTNLVDLMLGNGVQTIGNEAFRNCSHLVDIKLGNGVKTIGDGAFRDCTSLSALEFPNSVDSIGNQAFYNCSSLTDLKLGNSVKTIGDDAFHGCTSLSSLEFPNSLDSIGSRAFYSCSSLTDLKLGNGVQTIGDDAFYKCSALSKINWGSNILRVGEGTFYGIAEDKKIYLPSFESWCATDFQGIYSTPMYNGGEIYCNGEKFPTTFTTPATLDRIGDYAFYNFDFLEEVSVSPNITQIGKHAFIQCNNLKKLVIEDSDTQLRLMGASELTKLEILIIGRNIALEGTGFSESLSLTTLNIRGRMTEIPSNLVANCPLLRSLTIPTQVTLVGDQAFSGCSSLVSVNIEDGSTPIAIESSTLSSGTGSTFAGAPIQTLYIGRNVEYKTTELSPFKNLTTLIDLTIGNKVTAINDYLFYGCQNITNMAIPSSVKSVGDYAFYDCCNSKLLVISSSVETIGKYAFYNCRTLKRISIPNSVVSIGDYAFRSCVGAENIKIGNKCKTIGDYAFLDCYGANSIEIGSSVERIGNNAFYNCNALQNIEIPNTVLSIGDNAFALCISAKSAVVGSSIAKIGAKTFADCESLESVTIGKNVTEIGTMAFFNCEQLENVVSCAINPPLADETVFSDYSSVLTVPAGRSDAYRSAYGCWPLFSKIEEADDTDIPMQTLSIIPSSLKLRVGDSFQLQCTIFPANATNKTISWQSGDENIASVSADGVTTAISSGTVVITAYSTDNSNIKSSCIIEIDEDAGISDVLVEDNTPVKIFNLQGCLIYDGKYAACKLPQGTYIVVTPMGIFKKHIM